MMRFIGTKLISAVSMNRLSYNTYRGWDLPRDENGEDRGYLVEYLDGGKSNHPDHAGYISWSPEEQFNSAYHSINSMSFGDAILMLKAGQRVARAGWNGKGMWLALIKGENWGIGGKAPYDLPDGTHIYHADFIAMKTAGNTFVPWLASQADMLASDWAFIE